MKLIYLSLGSNLGLREQYLEEAIKLIQSRIGEPVSISPVYESEPWGYSSNNKFCNCCLSVRSSLDPLKLLDCILEIEKEMGRERDEAETGYSDRIIDIDLLFYENLVMAHPRLNIPHPAIANRKFILVPLNDIAPEMIHPVSGITVKQMLQQCADSSELRAF